MHYLAIDFTRHMHVLYVSQAKLVVSLSFKTVAAQCRQYFYNHQLCSAYNMSIKHGFMKMKEMEPR
jgi:hypothetical protein